MLKDLDQDYVFPESIEERVQMHVQVAQASEHIQVRYKWKRYVLRRHLDNLLWVQLSQVLEGCRLPCACPSNDESMVVAKVLYRPKSRHCRSRRPEGADRFRQRVRRNGNLHEIWSPIQSCLPSVADEIERHDDPTTRVMSQGSVDHLRISSAPESTRQRMSKRLDARHW